MTTQQKTMDATTTEAVVDAIYDAGLEPEDALYAGYSGRFMYGDTCFGIVGDAAGHGRFMVELASSDHDLAVRLLDVVRTDDMATQTIWYYPGFRLDGDTLEGVVA